MTQEQKAKRYDEALERAIKLQENSNGMILKKWLLDIFPELRESENERIRKEMIFYFQEEIPQCSIKEHADKMREFITWLEKKGEPKPKANTGDWLVHNERKNIVKIINHTPLIYEVVNHLGYCHTITNNAIENNYHLWTIQDAKDGDILAVENRPFIYNGKVNPLSVGGYCGITTNGLLKIYEERPGYGHKGWTMFDGDIHPATKEQREQLEKAIADAGFMWDAEKKELKKPAWSEED